MRCRFRAAAWTPSSRGRRNHPVVDAYRAFKPMPYDAPSRALAAVLHAVSPDENYFDLSEPGTITVLDNGRTRFHAVAAGQAPLSDRQTGSEGARAADVREDGQRAAAAAVPARGGAAADPAPQR